MIGDHHGRAAGRATLLVRAVDEILGTHNSARRRKSSRPGQRRRPEHGTRQLSCPGASRARQVRHGRRPPPALPARAVSSLARPRRPVRKPWAVGGAGKGQLQSRVAANGRPRLGSHAGTGAAGRRAGGQRRQAAPRAASGGCRGAPFGYLALRWWRKR
jgi:hypothetical protein